MRCTTVETEATTYLMYSNLYGQPHNRRQVAAAALYPLAVRPSTSRGVKPYPNSPRGERAQQERVGAAVVRGSPCNASDASAETCMRQPTHNAGRPEPSPGRRRRAPSARRAPRVARGQPYPNSPAEATSRQGRRGGSCARDCASRAARRRFGRIQLHP